MKTKEIKHNEKYVMLNIGARGYIKEINDDLFDFYNQPYMAFIPAKRRAQFKAIMTKLVELEPGSKDLIEVVFLKEDKTKPVEEIKTTKGLNLSNQLEFNFNG